MKLLKVFGAVVGIHVFALILIFANPGCSSASQPAVAASEPAVKPDLSPSPTISVPSTSTNDSPMITVPSSFDPNAPAVASSTSVRFSPTRPGTSAAQVLEAQPVADVTPATTYTVGKGDSLWTIAKKNHVTLGDLAAANNIKTGSPVHVGQRLIIPGKTMSAPSSAAKTAELGAAKAPVATTPVGSDSVKHVVKAGETLGAIARKYQVKMGDIATANNIADPAKIRPGMELVIPGWQAPVAKGGTKTAAKAAVVPTISVSGEDPVSPARTDAPPTISVEDSPAPKKF